MYVYTLNAQLKCKTPNKLFHRVMLQKIQKRKSAHLQSSFVRVRRPCTFNAHEI